MDVTLTIDGRDFSQRLATYSLSKEIDEARLLRTLDGTEHAYQTTRDVISFSLWPYDDQTAMDDYYTLRQMQFVAEYTDPQAGMESSQYMRVTSNLDAVFGLRSVDGNRYYKGGTITLRAVRDNT